MSMAQAATDEVIVLDSDKGLGDVLMLRDWVESVQQYLLNTGFGLPLCRGVAGWGGIILGPG